MLLRRASRTVNELAEALGLTDNAVRAHLSTLERDGLVEQSGVRPSLRKPNYAYDLTPEAEHLFPKAYGAILKQLLDVLSERVTPEVRNEMLREVARRMASGRPQASAKGDLRGRIEKAAEIIGELGGLAEVEEQEGKFFIRGCSCPLATAVPDHPEVCRFAETLLTEVSGVPFRERCERGDVPRCTFEALN